MHVYPSVFATVGLATSFVAFASSWELWAQSLREKEFLVEMRLQNLEPGTPSTDETPAENNQVAPAVPLAAEVGDEAADSDDDDDDAD